MTEIEVQVFGALKTTWPSGRVKMQVEPGSSVADLKAHLVLLGRERGAGDSFAALVASSALATPDSVLRDDECLEIAANMSIAVLPPVCGG